MSEIEFQSIAELVRLAETMAVGIGEVMVRYETQNTGFPRSFVWDAMLARWSIMQEAMQRGIEQPKSGMGGLVKGNAFKMARHVPILLDPIMAGMAARALAVNECNAAMERIVAAPTAGSSGILPAVIWGASQRLGSTTEQIVNALFVAAGLGMVMANNATISGAQGACMAEVGVSAAMAAGAACELAGGNPSQVAHAMALALKNTLGLACDPVGGLVEVPCVKRNAVFAAHAMTAAELALAGVESFIPPDEVIGAMKAIGEAMPTSLKETANGGLAVTPTGLRVKEAKASL